MIKDTFIDKAGYEKCLEESGKTIADCQKQFKTCQKTNNAKVCEPSTTDNMVSQNLH